MFDIHLSTGCHTLPKQEVLQHFPALAAPSVQQLLEKAFPEFLNIDVPYAAAAGMLDILKSYGARGLIVPAIYREPKITVEQAYQIACAEIQRKQAAYPNIHFDPVGLVGGYTQPRWWTFGANAQEWIEAGCIPGRLSASVDKIDGHIWTPEAQEQLWTD